MPRDYAKKTRTPQKRRAATKRKKQGFPTAAVLAVGMIVGGFIAFLAYLKWMPQPNGESQIANQETTEKKTEPSEKKQPKEEAANVPKYTFHDLLEGKQVNIPEEELSRPENKVSMEYVMPCGSFRSENYADELKAKIAFMGFESKIVPVEAESGSWFRVQLGPYASKRQAESIRHRLQQDDINDCKIWGRKL